MTESLWPQLRLKADTWEEVIERYRQYYQEVYVWDEHGNRRVFTDWAGSRYLFSEKAFDHAFSESRNYRTSAGIHHQYSLSRLRRLPWIREVLAHSAGTIQRYAQTRKDSRGRDSKRRTLVVVEERYVVVFDDPRKPDKPFQFVTAFPSDPAYLEEIRRRSFLAETRPASQAGARK